MAIFRGNHGLVVPILRGDLNHSVPEISILNSQQPPPAIISTPNQIETRPAHPPAIKRRTSPVTKPVPSHQPYSTHRPKPQKL